jgi:hypothetical protein
MSTYFHEPTFSAPGLASVKRCNDIDLFSKLSSFVCFGIGSEILRPKYLVCFSFFSKLQKIPLRAEFSPLLKKVNVNVQNLNFMLILILNEYFKKSALKKVRRKKCFSGDFDFLEKQFFWVIFL